MLESALTRKMVRELHSRGAWAVKIHGDPRQRRGLPDIIACYKARFIGIEVKVPGKERTLTPIQSVTLEGIRNAKGLAYVMSSVEQVTALLDRIDELQP